VNLPTVWRDEPLPKAWPDHLKHLPRLIRWMLTAPRRRFERAELPAELALPHPVPDYAREAFHGLPNGYYSLDIVEGYDRGFELVMLGGVQRARERMVEHMLTELRAPEGDVTAPTSAAPTSAAPTSAAPTSIAPSAPRRALDVGCGSGRLANTLSRAGFDEVWGIDPSPYMLQRAVRRTPEARFTQGVIERTTFPDGYFDAAGACFLFHELPGATALGALDELRRILRPGGVLCITDPCPDHLRAPSRWRLFRDHGWRALYFHALARFVYEPFLADWHSITDHRAWFDAHGFELVTREVSIPFSTLVARRR
jgi:SAM-dependent methyltransferase